MCAEETYAEVHGVLTWSGFGRSGRGGFLRSVPKLEKKSTVPPVVRAFVEASP